MIPGANPYSVVLAWAAESAPGPPGGPPSGGGPLARHESTVAGSSPPADLDPDDGDAAAGSPFDLALARFLAGGDDAESCARRDSTFKLIPRVTEGSWIIKQSVGTTPCLLGHKLKQRYARGPNYFEVDIDVSSSSVASTVVGLVMGATKAVVVDMAIVMQGNAEDELPEALLGG